MNNDWYYLDAFNQPQGPFTTGTIQTMAKSADFYVCKAGFKDWILASDAGRLFDKASTFIYHLEPVGHGQGQRPSARDEETSPSGTSLDADGQPINTAFNAVQNMGKSLDALYGICRGVLIDGQVSQNECGCMHAWLVANPSIAEMWPANVISNRLHAITQDGIVTPEEASDLRLLLEKAVGGRPSVEDGITLATRLPLTEPFPEIKFKNQSFCFTGKFAYGTRAKCREAVWTRGGSVEERVTGTLDYLVIGTIASRDWAHTAHGRKIESARRRKATKIVSEEHWVSFL
jgi:hypothetical protein